MFYSFFNCFVDPLNIGEYVSVTKPYYLYTEFAQLSCPDFVLLFARIFIMLSAISFNTQSILRSIKIKYISANRKLPSEFYSS